MEQWDIYNQDKKKTGKTVVRGTALEKGEYHLVVGIWTITDEGKILLTQRHPDKDAGLLWECSGGGVLAGESSLEGAVRELGEEVGIHVSEKDLVFLGTILTEKYFVDSYLYKGNVKVEDLKLQEKEVVDAKLVTLAEFDEMDREHLIVTGMVEEFRAYQMKLLKHVTDKK